MGESNHQKDCEKTEKMKLVSWNVNGLRAVLKKNFQDDFKAIDADIFCLQETKMQEGQADLSLLDYHEYWNSADKKGYSGTAIFSKIKPLSASYGLGIDEHDHEGRVITLEYDDFYLLNVYVPNSQDGLARLSYRMTWEDAFRAYVSELDKRKPVAICGDMNVAHNEIDLANPKTNTKNPGFTPDERGKMTALLNAGFTDTFRALHPTQASAYTWWSYRSAARTRNVGWRIDYFIVSNRLMERITAAEIYADVLGSDHCPVGIVLEGD
jgi:exodeoxyribonuclease-3